MTRRSRGPRCARDDATSCTLRCSTYALSRCAMPAFGSLGALRPPPRARCRLPRLRPARRPAAQPHTLSGSGGDARGETRLLLAGIRKSRAHRACPAFQRCRDYEQDGTPQTYDNQQSCFRLGLEATGLSPAARWATISCMLCLQC